MHVREEFEAFGRAGRAPRTHSGYATVHLEYLKITTIKIL
jgi:hypothetical protein